MQFGCLGDWERVTEYGPWNYKGNEVVIAPYDGYSKPTTIPLDTLEIWAQIHDFPDGFYPLLPSLAAKLGEFVFAEPQGQDYEGDCVRVRVKIDVYKALQIAV